VLQSFIFSKIMVLEHFTFVIFIGYFVFLYLQCNITVTRQELPYTDLLNILIKCYKLYDGEISFLQCLPHKSNLLY
jgi:hypothetical protein